MAVIVTLVNRTSKTLEGTWDGKHYQLIPGKHAFPEIQAEAFRRQNPLMGSEDPRTLKVTYLLGIEEQKDDCTPLEQSDSIEKWDRSKLPEDRQKVNVVTGGLTPFESHSPQSPELAFVKP